MTPHERPGERCHRCGRTPSDVAVPTHSTADPLQVTECPRCGSILRIGGHDW